MIKAESHLWEYPIFHHHRVSYSIFQTVFVILSVVCATYIGGVVHIEMYL